MKKIQLIVILLLLALVQLVRVSAEEVNVSIYVLNLGEYNPATGSFSADFYLHFKCRSICNTENFEFINGRANNINIIQDMHNEKFYRVHANLHSPVNLEKFPFDKQRMYIILEDTNNAIENLEYIVDYEESGIDNFIVFPGWNIDGWDAEVRNHYYPVYNETYSQYVFTVTVSKILFGSFIKTFLPVLFILLVVLFSFVLDVNKIYERLTMNGSGLIASVMFHITISNQIPPVGYLTFADKFMVVTYLIILTAFVINTYILMLIERKNKMLVEKIHRYTKYNMFIVTPLLYFILFVFFL